MRLSSIALSFACSTLASREFLNEPETGLQDFLGPKFPVGKLPKVEDLWSIPDFEYAARNYLNETAYTWIRYATGAEYTYRNNLEMYSRIGFKPRVLTGTSNVNMTMSTNILGHNFSAPFFISPAAAPGLVGGYVPKDREMGLLNGSRTGDILYITPLYAEMSIEEYGKAKEKTGQVTFQQLYAQEDKKFNQDTLDRAKKSGAKAIVWTVDAPADGAWVRGARFTLPPRLAATTFTWDFFKELKNMTDLPIILKGITNVDDAKKAASMGADGVFLSNHGGRHLDGAPTALSIALALHDQAPEVFKQTEVYADGGVRYGSDILKLLALGCKAVGLGRSFMYANVYGTPGVERAIDLLKKEIYLDAVNLGVTDLTKLDTSYLDLNYLRTHIWDEW